MTSMLVVLLSQRNRAGEESRPRLVGACRSVYQSCGMSAVATPAAAAEAAAVVVEPGSSGDVAAGPLVLVGPAKS